LIAEWTTTAEPPAPIVPETTTTYPCLIDAGGIEESSDILVPRDVQPVPDAASVLIEIPADIARLRRERPELAEAWRLAVRQAFRIAFDAGYRAVQVLRDDSSGHSRAFYVLERDHPF
jgi:predicted GNAT superfamily acetyltransferase